MRCSSALTRTNTYLVRSILWSACKCLVMDTGLEGMFHLVPLFWRILMLLIRRICCHLPALALGTKDIYARPLIWLTHNLFYCSMLGYSYLNGNIRDVQVTWEDTWSLRCFWNNAQLHCLGKQMNGTDSAFFSGVKTCASGGLMTDLIVDFRNFLDTEKFS